MGAINRENMGTHLFEYQLALIGKTIADTHNDFMWRFNWTITREQFAQFKGYAIPLFKKVYKCNRARAENNFHWFYKEFGLRIE